MSQSLLEYLPILSGQGLVKGNENASAVAFGETQSFREKTLEEWLFRTEIGTSALNRAVLKTSAYTLTENF